MLLCCVVKRWRFDNLLPSRYFSNFLPVSFVCHQFQFSMHTSVLCSFIVQCRKYIKPNLCCFLPSVDFSDLNWCWRNLKLFLFLRCCKFRMFCSIDHFIVTITFVMTHENRKMNVVSYLRGSFYSFTLNTAVFIVVVMHGVLIEFKCVRPTKHIVRRNKLQSK